MLTGIWYTTLKRSFSGKIFNMCIWSAYTGKSAAAPILRDSLQKIEGLWSGFYPGLATCHQGNIHMGKVLGNSSRRCL